MSDLKLPERTILLDGGMGRELRFRGIDVMTSIWSAKALPHLAQTGMKYVGGYANIFQPIPEDWDIKGDKKTDGSLDLRADLDPEHYAQHASDWIEAGATVIGGCCGTRPAHIARLKALLDEVTGSG